LTKIYRKHRVSYRTTSLNWRQDSVKAVSQAAKRGEYALKMLQLKADGADFLYFDESSFCNWNVQRHAWQQMDH